jgi:uncharacterized protein YraI
MAKVDRCRSGAVRILLAAGIAVAALGVSSAANAYEAYVTANEPLLAGPGVDYPPVADLSSGEPVQVYGCVDGWYWCDVSFQGYRGWFDGSQLVYPFEGQRVPLGAFGVRVGIPVIRFSFDEYWGAHYRDRPFFAERARYAGFGVRPRGGQAPHPEVQRAPPHLDPGHAPEQRHAAPRKPAADQASHPRPQEQAHPAPAPRAAQPPHGEEHGGDHPEEERH